jgi:DNA polymerase III sliding clamp (beta) subunit (PCNA family)
VDVPEVKVGPICVPAKKLYALLRNLQEAPRLEVRGGNLVVNENFVFPGLDPKEYPAVSPVTHRKVVTTCLLPTRWPDVRKAAAPDETRLQLSGVCLDFAAGWIVASDGHRLHMAPGLPRQEQVGKVIVPPSAAMFLAELMRQGQPIRCEILQPPPRKKAKVIIPENTAEPEKETTPPRPEFALFRVPGLEFSTRLTEAEYPDYAQVMPNREQLTFLRIPRVAFEHALKTILPFTDPHNRGLHLEMKSPTQLEVSFQKPGEEQLTLTVPVESGRLQFDKPFGVDIRYVLDAVSCFTGETVQWGIKDAVSPFLLSEEDFDVVIMPMKIL